MKNVKIFSIILGITILTTVSCKKEGCTDENANNYSSEAKKDDGSCSFDDNKQSVPASYTFERNGTTTVSFGGQTQRLEMLSEMVTYLKTANTAGIEVSEATVNAMYENSHTWIDTDNLGLTGSSKQLKSKTAYGQAGGSADAGVQSMFMDYFSSMSTISAATTTGNEDGAAGADGIWANDGVKGPYLMSGKGMEYAQLIEKGLMCAVFMNQMTVNYLANISNDNNTDLETDKNYTKMEHHWDEAYGYFTSATDYAASGNGTDRFWGKYASKRESVLQSASKISAAFRAGRTAIINKDYDLRDGFVYIINEEIIKVSAGTAIHYMKYAKDHITDNTAKNHALSEAYAFTNGLKYAHNSISGVGISASEVDQVLNLIGTDFTLVTLSNLTDAIDLLASKTGLTNKVSAL